MRNGSARGDSGYGIPRSVARLMHWQGCGFYSAPAAWEVDGRFSLCRSAKTCRRFAWRLIMTTHSDNRLLVTSLALSAAGVLACIACLLETFLPRGSLSARLSLALLAGIAVAAVMLGFAWACERLAERKERNVHGTTAHDLAGCPRAVTSARGGQRAVLLEWRSRSAELPRSRRFTFHGQ
jgi:hypothetical protein